MFRRKAEGRLQAWKESGGSIPILLRGLRQTGKTTLAKMFALSNYPSDRIALLDFRRNLSLHSLFDGTLDPDVIVSCLAGIFPELRILPGKSILIFDEVQDCSRARASFRYFKEEGKFHVIATGSYLGLAGYNQEPGISVPVGSERYIDMLPLDFEEFLWALGYERLSDEIRESLFSRKALPEVFHQKAEELYRAYIAVGGMPDSVLGYLDAGLSPSREACLSLMRAYKDDFGRHIGRDGTPGTDRTLLAKTLRIMDSVTHQIAEEKGSFAYSRIEDGARRRSYEDAMVWLEGYRLVYRCHLLKRIALPLFDYEDEETFKVYLADTGLLLSQFENGLHQDVLLDKGGIYKGPLYENAVATALVANGFPLRYYKRSSGLEIDFVIALGNHAVLLEVKAKGGRSKSLSTVLANKKMYGDDSIRAIKLTGAPLSVSQDGETIHMPHYCLPYLTPDMDLFG